MKVWLSPQAKAEATRIILWWRTNRDEQNFFEDELRAALARLGAMPGIGLRVQQSEAGRIVRRFSMRRARHYLFYEVLEEQQLVRVLRIWHASSGGEPSL